MTIALPAAGPAVTQAPDNSLACWANGDHAGRCYAKAINDLGLCGEHLDKLHAETEAP